ncbi:MAG: ectoine hydroxylase [Alphaproteobacteria bacterium]|nr:ectoine hydroxylase [Alphaproteobacteria bacterium]
MPDTGLLETVTQDAWPSRIDPAPRWIGRTGPTVRSAWSPKSPLTKEQHECFERDGFVVLKNLFKPAEIAALQDELAHLRADQSSLEADTIIREPSDDDAIRSIFAIHRQSALFNRLASDQRLVDIARHVLADEAYIHQSRLNYKPGFRGKEFYWHSDFETWHVEDGMPDMRAISISILLTENRDVNGPLMLMPGSHRNYITCVGETPEDHFRKSLRKQEYGVPDEDSLRKLATEGGIASPTGPAGTVVIFDCNTMHGSNGNITPLPRANAFLVYNAVSNALLDPFGPKKPRPDYIAARKETRALKPVAGEIEAAGRRGG